MESVGMINFSLIKIPRVLAKRMKEKVAIKYFLATLENILSTIFLQMHLLRGASVAEASSPSLISLQDDNPNRSRLLLR